MTTGLNDGVQVTQGLLALVSLLRKARDLYETESDVASFSGMDDPGDAVERVTTLLGTYRSFANRVGLSQVGREVAQALLDFPVPISLQGFITDEAAKGWVFSMKNGWRKVGATSLHENVADALAMRASRSFLRERMAA